MANRGTNSGTPRPALPLFAYKKSRAMGQRRGSGLNPDRDVTTIGDVIYFQYATIIAKRGSGVADGREANGRHYGFLKQGLEGIGKGSQELGGGRGKGQTYVRIEGHAENLEIISMNGL